MIDSELKETKQTLEAKRKTSSKWEMELLYELNLAKIELEKLFQKMDKISEMNITKLTAI